VFVGNAGHDNTHFARELGGAIERRDLARIRMCAPTVEHMSLSTKVRILDVIRTEKPEIFDRAAGKFLRDFIIERRPGLTEIGHLVDRLDPIMFARARLLELADPRRR
jgi:hypothetical protein